MTKRVSLVLIALSIALGIHTPCYGLYVMVRSGFGELKGEDVGRIQRGVSHIPTSGIVYNLYRSEIRNTTSGAFKYKDHKNLSVALGGRFDIFDIGSFGLELEILGAYANLDQKNRRLVNLAGYQALAPDFFVIGRKYIYDPTRAPLWNLVCLYLKNQRIAGAQINAYWEQYILDWLSVGIGGGLGGAYVCTRFTTLEWFRRRANPAVNAWFNATLPVQRHKYVHSGSLLYNFTLFVRAEQFETLFEVGYRHIGLHQMFGAKMYGYTIPKLANLHSDQVYIGMGRTF